MVRVLLASVVLHVALGAALAHLRVIPPAPRQAPVEVSFTPANVAATEKPPEPTPPPAERKAPRASTPQPALRNPQPVARNPQPAARDPQPVTRDPQPVASTPASAPAPAPGPAPGPAAEPPPRPGKVDLFAPTALTRAANIDLSISQPARGYTPRRGVGGDSRSGGTDIGSFLAEDAARMRVNKGTYDPELHRIEKRLTEVFQPTFAQADNSNRAQLFLKQFRGFLKNPPKTGELGRTIDPTKETLAEKLRSARPDQAFFLGRRIEIFVRQSPDGTIKEIAIRQASGYKAYDDMALAAVEKALAGRVPASADKSRDVRTLWQLDATAYVVISPQPELVFDEASGKSEWLYPLKKRIDKAVNLVAVY